VYQHDHAPTHTARLVTEGFDEDESEGEQLMTEFTFLGNQSL